MRRTEYDIWALRINEAIQAKRNPEAVDKQVGEAASLRKMLLEFCQEAAAIVGAIGRNIEDVKIIGSDRPRTMEGYLDEMLKFDKFSLLEYRYKIPSKREPGLRFQFDMADDLKRIAVHFFEDLVFWPVDEANRRVFEEPIQFDLTEGKIRILPHPDLAPFYAGCSTWQAALRETLALPFKHLYDPADTCRI